MSQVFVRLTAEPFDLLLHRRRVTLDKSNPIKNSAHGCGFELLRLRLHDDLLSLIEAIEAQEGSS